MSIFIIFVIKSISTCFQKEELDVKFEPRDEVAEDKSWHNEHENEDSLHENNRENEASLHENNRENVASLNENNRKKKKQKKQKHEKLNGFDVSKDDVDDDQISSKKKKKKEKRKKFNGLDVSKDDVDVGQSRIEEGETVKYADQVKIKSDETPKKKKKKKNKKHHDKENMRDKYIGKEW